MASTKSRPRKWHQCASGFKYDMNGKGMSPFFIGFAAAEFLPADPQVWFDAASAAGMTAENAWTPGFVVGSAERPAVRTLSPHG